MQVKFGNWEAREKPKVEAWQPKEEQDPKSATALRSHTLEDLEGDLEDIGDDDRFLEEYRWVILLTTQWFWFSKHNCH